MLWLEMSRDPTHGGESWAFTRCLWSPSRKQNQTRWAFWETVLQVQSGDTVLHLRGEGEDAAFVGFSTADGDGFETSERPPTPGQWAYSERFHRALLKEYVQFAESVPLNSLFLREDTRLRAYFEANATRDGRDKRRLFYVLQAGRIQCLNGAYLSEVDKELCDILLSAHETHQLEGQPPATRQVVTGEQLRLLKTRMGQSDFSDAVRGNYGNRCCFPGCTISDKRFLVGAHIARWSDAPLLRGDVSNGLCLCLMHDKAFEIGLFTLDFSNRIWVNQNKCGQNSWAIEYVSPFQGKPILIGKLVPMEEALLEHWQRTNLYPQ